MSSSNPKLNVNFARASCYCFTFLTNIRIQILYYLRCTTAQYCNGSAQGVHMQRVCKYGNYATVEESCVFHAMSVAALPLLHSAEVNIFPLLGNRCKCLDRATARVGRGHVTSACSAVTQQ
jgi:hypothetical protein